MLLNFLPGVSCDSFGILIEGTHHGGVPLSLNVHETCSGMRLLRVFLALGVAMAYLEYRPVIHRAILLISTVPIAIFCNMLRVLLTGLIYIYLGAEYAQGSLHTVLGLVMLPVAFGLYWVLAWVMKNLYMEEKSSEDILVVKKKCVDA